MSGITGYSVYIPRHRLSREAIAAAWATKAPSGSKAVAHFDEDSLTLGHAAAAPLASGVEALYFASTTAPYWQRSAASLIAACCDLPAEVATADFGGSLRCGATALRAALDTGKRAVVVASDTRQGAPESAEEMLFGDAAAAIAVGPDPGIAELVAAVSRSDDFPDEWRRDTDAYVQSFTSKFSTARGYEANVVAAGRALLEQAGLEPARIARVALVSPDGRAHLGAALALGIPAGRIEDPRLADVGITGAAMPLLLLAQALDRASAGDYILVIGYGDGADAMLFRAVRNGDRRLAPDPHGIPYPSYQIYRKLRDYLRLRVGGAEVSNVLWEREETQNVRLHGTRCPRCGLVQFPIARVCSACRNAEGLVEQPLARRGRVFTFTKDFLYEAPIQPTVMAVVDLDGGGRFLCQMTDVDAGGVEIGMEVELVLRRMRESAASHHYYWKCRRI
ncbi:MAG: hydroxymethylglutaryl-CoA synthase family protein [Acidobacteria bacterium]|nr:hydroxymethylglutaryl-CoA synthase family protein [Acidobacteriota bacterium]